MIMNLERMWNEMHVLVLNKREHRVCWSGCEGFSNFPLMGSRGCINYNPILAIRQLAYHMKGAPLKESITPFITRGLSDPNARIFQRV